MKEFFTALGNSKIPSILLLMLLYASGIYLIKGETGMSISAIAGVIILIIAGTLTVFSYADFRKREETDSIIKSYDKALTSISNTHSKFEENQQKTLTDVAQTAGNNQAEQKDYNIEGEQPTLGQ